MEPAADRHVRRHRPGDLGVRRGDPRHGLTRHAPCPVSTTSGSAPGETCRRVVAELERSIDDALRADWDITIEWFDVLTRCSVSAASARPLDIAASICGCRRRASARRLDRLEEEGWIARHRQHRRRQARRRRRTHQVGSSTVARDERQLSPGVQTHFAEPPRRRRHRRSLRHVIDILDAPSWHRSPRRATWRVDRSRPPIGVAVRRGPTTEHDDGGRRMLNEAVLVDAVRTPFGRARRIAVALASGRSRRRDTHRAGRPHRDRRVGRRRRDRRVRHAGRRAGHEPRAQRRCSPPSGPNTSRAPPSIASADPGQQADPLRCAGGDGRCLRRRRRVRRRSDDPGADGGVHRRRPLRLPVRPSVSSRYADRGGLVPQGESAELIADRWGLHASELDEYGLRSQQRAAPRHDEGRFDGEVIAVSGDDGDTRSAVTVVCGTRRWRHLRGSNRRSAPEAAGRSGDGGQLVADHRRRRVGADHGLDAGRRTSA